MFQNIIRYSIDNKLLVGVLLVAIIVGGIWSLRGIPLDAVPDITNNQVQVVTSSPTLAAEEIEQLITYPIEASLANIPNVVDIRSISRYGLSVITIVFSDEMEILDARQFVKEQLGLVEIPRGLGTPELMPITTGLGEIYQYTLQVDSGYEERYNSMDLRTIQDWIVKRQLTGIPGIIEVSSFGGYLKQYEVSLKSEVMIAMNLSVEEVVEAVRANNNNSGSGYMELGSKAKYIRTFGRLTDIEEIKKVVVSHRDGTPIFLRDIADIGLGYAPRYGAMTMDGKGEVVGGITLMLKGSNSSETISNVKEKIDQVKKLLPEGVILEPYLDRSVLIGKAIHTVTKNLVEGGLIVIFVLMLLLGSWRGGLIVASVIPLSMLFAFIMMRLFDVSANLMSLGAIDFGIVVDGAVIIVEGVLHALFTSYVGNKLTQNEFDHVIKETSGRIYKSAAFGVLIILVVFFPIMTLTGIEGKMFKPMAYTVSFAILGAMILSLTYVPVAASLILKKDIKANHSLADRIMTTLRGMYKPTLAWALRFPRAILSIALVFFLVTTIIFTRMGAEFIPNLEEGDLAMQMTIPSGSSLSQSIRSSTKAEKILLENFPEVKHVVSKIGTAEVPTDPMAIEDADIMIIMEEKDNWTSADNREDLVALMKEKLSVIVEASFEFTQPIQLRFNELMTGAKTDISIKIFGENPEKLAALGAKAESLVRGIEGVGDARVEQTEGLPQQRLSYDREMMAYYGVNIDQINQIIESSVVGVKVGEIFEDERKFDLVVRNKAISRGALDLTSLQFKSIHGELIPVNQVVEETYQESPLLISREWAKRRINVGVNVRNRDMASTVSDIQNVLTSKLKLPPGYFIDYGGQFENLEAAKLTLSYAVPAALFIIIFLLYITFHSVKDAAIIFVAVPLSAIGGVLALWVRGMPFSISAGVGFIALFGVSVLNGIVLISYYIQLKQEGVSDIKERIIMGGLTRLRPVVMTAAVASMGFLPMALSTTAGAEVQRPLATVVIGGLITSTFLTLIVLPVIYYLMNNKSNRGLKPLVIILMITFSAFGNPLKAQKSISLDQLLDSAVQNHPSMKVAEMSILKSKAEKKGIYDPGKFQLNYSYGQINAGVNDYHLNLMQPLGNIPQALGEGKGSKMQITLAEVSKQIRKRALIRDVTMAYIDWVYEANVMNTFKEHLDYLKDAEEKAKVSVEYGDKSLLDLSYLKQDRMMVENELLRSEMNLRMKGSLLKELTLVTDLAPVFEFPDLIVEGGVSINPLFQEAINLREEISEQQLQVEKLGFFPGVSVGYFNQQLEGAKGFEGWQVGLNFPLWYQPQISRIQKKKIDVDIQQQQNIQTQNNLFFGFEKAQESYEKARQTYEKASDELVNSERLLKVAEESFEAGEINYFQFLQTINQLYHTERNILEIKLQYLQSISELKFYTK